ncbi:MAG: acyl-CoA dehydrogenase family protein [Micromonosporaceae bacterium]|nr:acyl-CoA dehydrogenase family protein [Micromonosporaceae bacterium]
MLTDEQEALRETVATFAREKVAPVIAGHYANHTFPYEVVAAMGAMGLFGLPFPTEYGGMGGDLMALGIAIEELARVDSSVAITLEAAVCLGAMPIYRYGTPEQKATWLPRLVSGEALAAFGLTEPEAGSDAAALQTRAVLDESTGEWVINGTKAFITNSGTDITALVTVAAVTGERDGRREISTILVPIDTPGLTVAPSYDKVGWCASDTHELSFVDVRVPAANLLGERGKGLAQFLRILDEGRVAIAALATGLAQGCVDESVAYAKRRVAFDRPIASFQAVAFMIADMQARAHVARLAWHDAASRAVHGLDFTSAAAIAKLTASETAVANARAATQIHGGYGFMTETPVARFWRDAKILEIGEGTSEVQRLIIARELGL